MAFSTSMMVSERYRSPRLRSSRYHFSSAAASEIFTVLFDPPSFLMTYSIVCHLWKISKAEKKFSPLPPLRKPPQESAVLSSEAVSFNFGSFNSEIVPIKPIESVAPLIEGSSIKIGEISCVLKDFVFASGILYGKDPVSASSVVYANDSSDYFDFVFESVANSTKIVMEDQEPQSFRDPSAVFSFVIANQFRGDNFRIVISAPPWFVGGDGYFPLIFDPGGVTVPLFIVTVAGSITLIENTVLAIFVFGVDSSELHLQKNLFRIKFEWLKSRLLNFLSESRLQKAPLRSNFGSFFDVFGYVQNRVWRIILCSFIRVSMFWRITEACFRKFYWKSCLRSCFWFIIAF